MDVNGLASVPPWEWPADAGEILLSALRGGKVSYSDRLLAVELAASTTVMNDDLAETLLAILHDPAEAEAIRSAAAIALGPTLEELDLDQFGDPLEDPDEPLLSEAVADAVLDGLRQVYRDPGVPKLVRRRALEGSVRAERDWHPAAVRAAYQSGDHDWKLTAVFCMRYVAGFDREILEALQSGDPALRYEAVAAAGNWALRQAWPHIRALVQSKATEKPLLLAAIEAAASIRPAEAAETLADLAASDDDEIADAVADALATARIPLDDPENPGGR
jgi:hypothetical protein